MNFNNSKLDTILDKLNLIEETLKANQKTDIYDFISEQEAREMIGRGTTWFWELRKSGFPYTKLGGQVYYKKQDLIDYLEKNKRGGGEQ